MLRHPVVITSIEEDFKRIGLIKNDDSDQRSLHEGIPTSSGGEVGSGRQGHARNASGGSLPKSRGGPVGSGRKSHQSNRDPNHDYGEDTDYQEALDFAERCAEEWDNPEDDAVYVEMSQEEMDEIESMGESLTLPGGVLSEQDDPGDEEDDEDDEEDDDEEDDMDESDASFLASTVDDDFFEDLELDAKGLEAKYGSDYESRQADMKQMMQALEGRRRAAGKRGMMRTKRMSGSDRSAARQYYRTHKSKIRKMRVKRGRTSHGKRLAKIAKSLNMGDESIARTMEHIESIVQDLNEDLTVDQAQPAFANIALVAEMLVRVFEAALDEDVGATNEMIEGFTDLARSSAEIVEFLHDNTEELDEDRIVEAFSDYMETLESGLEIYESIRSQLEAADPEGKDEDAA